MLVIITLCSSAMVGLAAFVATEVYKVRTSKSLEASNLQAEIDLPDLKKTLAEKKKAAKQALFNKQMEAFLAEKAKKDAEAEAEAAEVETEETQTEPEVVVEAVAVTGDEASQTGSSNS